MQTIRITTSQNIDIDYEVAGLGERIVARLIDLGIFIVLYFLGLILGIVGGIYEHSETMIYIAMGVYLFALAFYDLACEIFGNGQSLGKKVMKIRVVSLNGAQPTVGQYLLRWLFRIIDFELPIPFVGLVALITAAVSEKTQRLGDIVAGTILVKTVPRTKIDNVIFTPMYEGYQPVFPLAGQLNDHDIELIHEVISNYMKSNNPDIVYRMAQRVKEHLNITPPNGMNDMLFLQTIIKDYNHISAQADML
jgi:uncharacterized RDD family membrane protein YckC